MGWYPTGGTARCPRRPFDTDKQEATHASHTPQSHARFCPGHPIFVARDALALLLPGRCGLYHLCLLLPTQILHSGDYATELALELCAILSEYPGCQSSYAAFSVLVITAIALPDLVLALYPHLQK